VRAVNEDLALESLTLFAVADGMGGHAGGEVAARTAIDALRAEFARKPSIDGLIDAVHEANRAVWDRGHAEPELRGMGTTLTAAALVATEEGDRLVLANVGDSRAYRFHDTGLDQLTTDHSVAEELVARGELSEAEAAVHPHRHILTRALGVGPDIDVDVWKVVPEEGDRYLLCSDGLTNEVGTDKITRVLSDARDPQGAAETLVGLANEAGGSDNVTVVVLDVVVGEQADAGQDDGAGTAVAEPVDGAPRGSPRDVDGLPSSASSPLATALAGTGVAADATVVEEPVVESRDAGAMVGTATDTTAPAAVTEAASGNGAGTALVGRSAAPRQVLRPSSRSTPPGRRPPRRITLGVLLFAIVLAGIGVAGWALIHWYVDGSYFVGLNHGQVVIYQGRPGGFVGFEPRVVQHSDMTVGEIPSYKVPDLRAGVQEPSLTAARSYVTNLRLAMCSLSQPPLCPASTTSVPSSPSTTHPSSLPATPSGNPATGTT
jgi:protein phosphatase